MIPITATSTMVTITFFSVATEIAHTPAWVWTGALGGYLLVAVFYHGWHKTFPYLGKSQWLAFPDLFAVTVIEYAQLIPPSIPIGLRYLQVVFLALGSRFSDKPRSSLFWGLYWGAWGMSGWVSVGLASPDGPPSMVILGVLGHLAAAVAIPFLVAYTRKHVTALENGRVQEKITTSWQQVAWQHKAGEAVQHYQKAVVYHLGHYQKIALGLNRRLLTQGQTKDCNDLRQIQECLQERASLLLSLESAITQKVTPLELTHGLEEELHLLPFLGEQFSRSFALQQATNIVDGTATESSPPQLQTHVIDNIPAEIKVKGGLFWRWLICCWLDYFLALGDRLTILLSHQEKSYILKGVGGIKAVAGGSGAEGVKCPLCLGHVRELYHIPFLSSPGCRECLKSRVEEKLQEDWEMPPRQFPSFPGLLWLARHSLVRFRLGSVHYGIQSWDRWEYFITLSINKGD